MPYTRGPLRQITDHAGIFSQPPEPSWIASEHWSALTDDTGFGFGLVAPLPARMLGAPGVAPDATGANGMLVTASMGRVDPYGTVSFDYTLVVGTLRSIRSYAYAHTPGARPAVRFGSDRQGWWEQNAHDAGLPLGGALRLRVDGDDPQLVSPEGFWPRVPQLYVRGRWTTRQNLAQVFWAIAGGGFTAQQSRQFVVRPDGRFHTYRVDLWRSPGYGGPITQLRLDPVPMRESGEIDIECISWRPCPPNRRAESAIGVGSPVPFLETFDTLDRSTWNVFSNGPDTSVDEVAGALVIHVGANARSSQSPPDNAGGGVFSRCRVAGDFDMQVDYRLLSWPDDNGVYVNFGAGWFHNVTRSDSPVDSLSSYFGSFGASVQTSDRAGSLRITRRAALLTSYYRLDGAWEPLYSGGFDRAPTLVNLTTYANPLRHPTKDVAVAFDNFRLNSGQLLC